MNMPAKITNTKEYILIEPLEAEYWVIWEAIGRLLKMPEYAEKNAIWVFSEGPLKTTFDDLYKLKDLVIQNYPEKSKPDRKIAIVAETGLYRALAEEYTEIKGGPKIEFKVFSDLKSAENWIKKS